LFIRNTSPHYFDTAQADPHGEIDKTHTVETHLIPLAVEAAQDSFVPVWDLATARVKAVDCLIAGGPSGSLNLRSGRGHSIRGVSSAVETVSRGSVSYFAGAAHRHAHWRKRATYWPKLSRNGRSFALISADPKFEPSLPGWRPLKSNLHTTRARSAAPKRRHEPVGGDAHREGTRFEQI